MSEIAHVGFPRLTPSSHDIQVIPEGNFRKSDPGVSYESHSVALNRKGMF